MKMTNRILLSSALALAVAGISDAKAAAKELCYGVAKAGQNDCKTPGGSCQGSSKIDNDKNAFLALPKGVCAKLAGGTLKGKK